MRCRWVNSCQNSSFIENKNPITHSIHLTPRNLYREDDKAFPVGVRQKCRARIAHLPIHLRFIFRLSIKIIFCKLESLISPQSCLHLLYFIATLVKGAKNYLINNNKKYVYAAICIRFWTNRLNNRSYKHNVIIYETYFIRDVPKWVIMSSVIIKHFSYSIIESIFSE